MTLDEYATCVRGSVFRFGDVIAIAPPTRFQVSFPKGKPDALHSLSPEKAFIYLLGTLNSRQWTALCGTGGLGFGDLDDTQAELLTLTIAPAGELTVHESLRRSSDFRDMTANLAGTKVRLSKTARVFFRATSPQGGYWRSDTVPGKYYLASGSPDGSYTEPPCRQEVENVFRPGGLAWDEVTLGKTVDLKGAKTVADVVSTLGDAVGKEIYADARYGKFAVHVNGEGAAVKAGDLVKALSVCLTATYRKVGPALLLTDDMSGIGSKRQAWYEFDTASEKLLEKILSGKRSATKESYEKQNVKCFEDSWLPSDDQIKSASSGEQWLATMVGLKYGSLNDHQKKRVKEIFDAERALFGPDRAPDLDSDTIVGLKITPCVELLIPNLDAPAYAGGLENALQQLTADETPTPAFDAGKGSPQRFRAAMKAFSSRAAVVNLSVFPIKPEILRSLAALGFESVWVSVPMESLVKWAAGDEESATAWRQALGAVRSAGLEMRVVVDPMARSKPSDDDADHDILGRTGSVPTYDKAKKNELTWLDPTLGQTRFELDSVAKWLARQPIKGVVVRHSTAPGYVLPWAIWQDHDPAGFGYSVAARLAFVRRWSVDPIDLFWADAYVKTVVNGFDYPDRQSGRPFVKEWNQARMTAGDQAVRRFAGAILGPRQVSVRRLFEQWKADWYGAWESPESLLPGSFQKVRDSFESFGGGVSWAHTFTKKTHGGLSFFSVDSLAMLAARLEHARKYGSDDAVAVSFERIADLGGFIEDLNKSLKEAPGP